MSEKRIGIRGKLLALVAVVVATQAAVTVADLVLDLGTVAVLAGVLVSAAVGVAGALVLGGSIRRTLGEALDRLSMLRDHCLHDLREGLGAMSGGDLTREVVPVTPPLEATSSDEIGDIARAVNVIRDHTVASVQAYNETRGALGALVGAMSESAGQVSAASQQMAASSDQTGRAVGEIAEAMEDVARGAERQLTSVVTVRDLTTAINERTALSADGARHGADAAAQAKELAREGAAAVTQATEAMAAVHEASVQATEAIRDLGRKSEQIGHIVTTITGIAEQTNLLALNAAIEAARAGDQGRGFAVVADEVRKLAEESQQAATSIEALIAEMQAETSRAVDVVDRGAQRTADGVSTVEQARSSFLRIDDSVADVTSRVQEIASATDELRATAEQMAADVADVAAVAEQASASTEQVSASTQETSASAQEIADAARGLASTAEELDALVQRFTLQAA